MQVVTADDLIAPIYFYVPDGCGWYDLTRGQVLASVDVRSSKIIAWSLQPERNYNSLVIRTLMNRVCADRGLPGVWLFERGIWKSAKLVKGESPPGWADGLFWPEAQVGWDQVGVRFIHATRARTKRVERVFGLIQDLMECVRGYCGRDELRDCPEVTKHAMDDVRASSTPAESVSRENHLRVSSGTGQSRPAKSSSCTQLGGAPLRIESPSVLGEICRACRTPFTIPSHPPSCRRDSL